MAERTVLGLWEQLQYDYIVQLQPILSPRVVHLLQYYVVHPTFVDYTIDGAELL